MAAPVLGPLCDYEARIVSLLGKIDTNEVNLLVDQLLRLDAESGKPITVFVSCQGGDIIQGLTLLDSLGLLRSTVTAVGMGLIEGAGVLLLAGAHERIVFPSALLSSAGLWDLPHLHPTSKRGIGLHQDLHPGDQLLSRLRDRMTQIVLASNSKLPGLLADPNVLPQIFDSTGAVHIGLADSIIDGPNRLLMKPPNKLKLHAKSSNCPSL